jgi:hypothetical protein
VRKFKFERDIDDNRWYVILPEWEGDRSDLEMVCGADTMLDILSKGENFVEMFVSDKSFDDHTIELSFDKNDGGGAWYKLKSDKQNFDVWLCGVTKFVFDDFPKKIYCK